MSRCDDRRQDTRVVGVMADPGLSQKMAQAMADELQDDLSAEEPSGGEWTVHLSKEKLPLNYEGDIPLLSHAAELRRRHGWGYVVYLTDLPRYHEDKPMVCELSAANSAALVSVTAMGAFRMKAKTRDLLVALIRSAQQTPADVRLDEVARSLGIRAVRQLASGPGRDPVFLVLPGALGQVRLLSGMVRSNNPGRMLPALATAITAGVATGGFGIYYGSIWTLADALHPVRLVLISAVVVAALTFWLIFRNGLWNMQRARNPWHNGLDNATTIIMVGSSVIMMYMLIAGILLGIGATVIDAEYLESELGSSVGLLDYVRLSWLSASLGTLAGALGSNFDDNEKIRAATYSKRQHERRERTNAYEE